MRCRWRQGLPTSATILNVRSNGERSALHVRGASDRFDIAPEAHDRVLDAPIVHLGGTGLLRKLDGEPSRALPEEAKRRGRTVTFDLIAATAESIGVVEPLLPYIDYFMPSTEGAGNMSGRRATLRDAAAHAGVSVATFSHVVNETKAVKACTRAAVLAAAAARGYWPNTVARSLVARRGRALSGLPESAPRLIAICYVSIDYMVEIDRVPQPGARTSSRSIEKMLGEPAANVAAFAAGMNAPLAVRAELVTLFATMPTAPGRLNGWPSAGWIAVRRCASPARGCRAVSSWSSRAANARSSTNPASAAGTCDASSHRSHGPGVPDVPAF